MQKKLLVEYEKRKLDTKYYTLLEGSSSMTKKKTLNFAKQLKNIARVDNIEM